MDPGATSVNRAAVAAPATMRERVRLALVGLGISVVPLDTAVNIAFPDITGSFGQPIPMIQWVVICYVLTHAGLMLAFGRVGDMWSHARVFRIGLAWSIVAFLLCAAAPSFGWLLFFRFLQGIAAGLIISCAPALVTGLYPEARRSHALGGRAAARRGTGRAMGLAFRVLVPRAYRAGQPAAAAGAAARRQWPPGPALRHRRSAAAGVWPRGPAACGQR